MANRKLIETLENRSREVAETGRLDLANLRVASKARAPTPRNLVHGLAVYGAAGFLVGLALALGLVAVVAALVAGHVPASEAKGDEPRAERLRDTARRMRAELG